MIVDDFTKEAVDIVVGPRELGSLCHARVRVRRIHDVRTACQFSMTLMAGNLQHAFLLQLVVIEPRVLCFFRFHASLHFRILSRFIG